MGNIQCWHELSRKEVMLGYNKNYTTLVLHCALKNSKETISASGIDRWYRNNRR